MNSGEEVYEDGTTIKNIKVAGVANKAAMFEPKTTGKSTPPVLRKFRNQQSVNTGTEPPQSKPAEDNKPSWAKKNSPGPTSPKPNVSPKTAPSIPQKGSKWSPVPAGAKPPGAKPIGAKPPTLFNKPTVITKTTTDAPQQDTFRKLSSDQNKPPDSAHNKDINHNVKTEPVNAHITKGTKRASVTDILKNFQSDSNSSEPRITSVKPLHESNKVSNTPDKPNPPNVPKNQVLNTNKEQSETNKSNPPSVVKKLSIQERIAALNTSEESAAVRRYPGAKSNAANRQSVIKRKTDSKSFKRASVSKRITPSGEPPPKPPKLSAVDLNPIKEEYKQKLIKHGQASRALLINGDDQETYDDIANIATQRELSVMIEPMTEEEEYNDIGNVMDTSSTIQEETYEDCQSSEAPITDTDEIYECFDEEDISGGSSTSKSKEAEKNLAEKKKREERERKEQEKREKDEKKKKEKEEKDRQKEQKKKEKEEKDRLVKLKVDGTEKQIGEGIIREDCSGVKLELSVNKGERVVIMRMDKNPKGKWLVTNAYGKWGYADADNVEVATPTIRKWMNNQESYANPDDLKENGIFEQDDELYEEL